jgi:hypothetical protein
LLVLSEQWRTWANNGQALAKVGVEGANPFARSKKILRTPSSYERAAKAALVVFAFGVPPGFLVRRCCLDTFGYVQTPVMVEPRLQ